MNAPAPSDDGAGFVDLVDSLNHGTSAEVVRPRLASARSSPSLPGAGAAPPRTHEGGRTAFVTLGSPGACTLTSATCIADRLVAAGDLPSTSSAFPSHRNRLGQLLVAPSITPDARGRMTSAR